MKYSITKKNQFYQKEVTAVNKLMIFFFCYVKGTRWTFRFIGLCKTKLDTTHILIGLANSKKIAATYNNYCFIKAIAVYYACKPIEHVVYCLNGAVDY